MPTTSKYVSDEDVKEAKQQLAGLAEEYKELDLLAKTGIDVSEARKQLDEAKVILTAFINTYDIPEKIQPRIKSK